MRRIIEREGVEGLYSGLNSALFGIAVTNFVYYYWYEWTKAAFERRPGRAPGKRLSTLEAMAAGALAGSATVILTNPIWVVNTRMTTRRRQIEAEEEAVEAPQTDAEKAVTSAAADVEASWTAAEREGEDAEDEASRQEKAKEKAQKELAKRVAARGPTTMGTLLSLLRNEGPAALFAGVAPALVLVINPILQYTLFEQMRNIVERRRGRGAVTPSVAFVLGAIGKLFATTVTYPYITVKSQMHVAGKKGKSESTLQALRRITREEGYAGLYKGE